MSEPSQMADIAKQQWDIIVIGTGIGGATLGYSLARAGQRVLFCEKGKSHLNGVQSLRGAYAENFFPRITPSQREYGDSLLRAGRYCDRIEDQSLGQTRTFIPFIGSGTGGSSALYGMAMERFFPSDFQPRRNYPDARETTLPEEWPISYASLAPYYEAAEELYRVHGTADPLRESEGHNHIKVPPPLTPLGSELFDFFERKGLHPYRLPMACEYVLGCECCQGYLCGKKCKNDASRICLEPAITNYGAQLLDECEVLRLDATRTEITGVVCAWQGGEFTLHGKEVILAAGALESPRILLRSTSERWPLGLANGSGLVGRNLMRHYIDLYLITPQSRGELDNRQKEFAFNDFYQVDGRKLGSVQSFGRLPPAAALAESMEDDIRRGTLPWMASLFKLAKPAIKPFLNRLVNRSMVLATTIEDIPYADNAVTPLPADSRASDGRLAINYRIHPRDKERIEVFRGLMKDILKPYRYIFVKQAENNERIAHACGTCRFGQDPRDSVLDMYNRAHGLSNLYIVDSSFFPSSGGTNPSLTIAANALRVAAQICDKSS
ncbi:MAG: GMC family oxidoreductase [Gallionellaceae bacterium]